HGATSDEHSSDHPWPHHHHVEMTVRLNSEPSLADGVIDVSVDGQPLIRHENLRFRSSMTSAGLVRNILFSTFHGGSSPNWAPRTADGDFKNDCAYFDDFAIRTPSD
ncbi:MAG: hypothetical protein LAT66_03545, partial [Alkalimonas sp.]|nr:hypothetical protein [Alkalimonas sp.]